jgi:hypothetical protein
MRWLTWIDTVNLLEAFNYYLILAFLVSTAIRLRSYWAIVGMIFASRARWPKLMELVKTHRTILLGWPTLLVIGLAFALMVSNSLAIRLVWAHAEVTFEDLRRVWLALTAVAVLGGLMLFLDILAQIVDGPSDSHRHFRLRQPAQARRSGGAQGIRGCQLGPDWRNVPLFDTGRGATGIRPHPVAHLGHGFARARLRKERCTEFKLASA